MAELDKKNEQTEISATVNNTQVIRDKKSEPYFLDFEFGMDQDKIDEFNKIYVNDGRISICKNNNYCYPLNLDDETIPMYMDIRPGIQRLDVIEEYRNIGTFNKILTFLISKYGKDYRLWSWQGKRVPEFIDKNVIWYLKNKTVNLMYSQHISLDDDKIDRFLSLSFDPPTLNIPKTGEVPIIEIFCIGQEDEYLKHKNGTPTQYDIKRTKDDF